jgi:hypothetical protein
MTALVKAVAFATHCLKWTAVSTAETAHGAIVRDGGSERSFNAGSAGDIQKVLAEFLGNRYFIQINRGKTSLFQWQVIVGQQGLNTPGASFNHAQAEDEDLIAAVLDACVEAARMDKRQSQGESRCASLEPEQDARQRGGSHES